MVGCGSQRLRLAIAFYETLMDYASSRQRCSVAEPMSTSWATNSNAALSGGNKPATARPLNDCPYRATTVFLRRPRVLGSMEAISIVTRGE